MRVKLVFAGRLGPGLQSHPQWALWLHLSGRVCTPLSFAVKLLVEQEDEQVDIDGGAIEELHHGHTFILQLQEILQDRDTHEATPSERWEEPKKIRT